MEATDSLRAALPGLLAQLGTRVLLDAPCGDLNWMSRVDLSGVTYVGVDTSEENLKTARRNAPALTVSKADIFADDLPSADTVLCRDFLQHLPEGLALRVLERLRATGANWLLATSHQAAAINEDIDKVGGFRPLNLTIPPIALGEPLHVIVDGPGRIVGVWAL